MLVSKHGQWLGPIFTTLNLNKSELGSLKKQVTSIMYIQPGGDESLYCFEMLSN